MTDREQESLIRPSKERLCGACGRIIPVGGSRDCGLDHALLEHCAKHGSHAPGECPRCDALAEARSIVATTYIPPAPPSSDERAALRAAEHALACIAAVTPEDTDVGRYARNYFRRQAKAPLVRESPHCPTCGCGLAPETCERCKEHEQFRHQHRDCDQAGIALHRIQRELASGHASAALLVVSAVLKGMAIPGCVACDVAAMALDREPNELKAFVQLCAPHGQDWLTCPECAKAAMGPQA